MIAFRPPSPTPSTSGPSSSVVGALLAVYTRTVAAEHRVTGHDGARFSAYDRILSRARWSCHGAARVLLGLVVDRFVPGGAVAAGLDNTVEHRWGPQIGARGVYRDPVRSSHGRLVKPSGLRWLSISVLSAVSWADRV